MVDTKEIKKLMKEKKKNQKDLAKALHLKQPTVSQKLNNVRPLDLEEAVIIAEELGIENEKFGKYFFAAKIA